MPRQVDTVHRARAKLSRISTPSPPDAWVISFPSFLRVRHVISMELRQFNEIDVLLRLSINDVLVRLSIISLIIKIFNGKYVGPR